MTSQVTAPTVASTTSSVDPATARIATGTHSRMDVPLPSARTAKVLTGDPLSSGTDGSPIRPLAPWRPAPTAAGLWPSSITASQGLGRASGHALNDTAVTRQRVAAADAVEPEGR